MKKKHERALMQNKKAMNYHRSVTYKELSFTEDENEVEGFVVNNHEPVKLHNKEQITG